MMVGFIRQCWRCCPLPSHAAILLRCPRVKLCFALFCELFCIDFLLHAFNTLNSNILRSFNSIYDFINAFKEHQGIVEVCDSRLEWSLGSVVID